MMSDGHKNFALGGFMGFVAGVLGTVMTYAGDEPAPEPEPIIIASPTIEMASLVGEQCMTEAMVSVTSAKNQRLHHPENMADGLRDCMSTCRSLSDWGDDIKANERSCALKAQQMYLRMEENDD